MSLLERCFQFRFRNFFTAGEVVNCELISKAIVGHLGSCRWGCVLDCATFVFYSKKMAASTQTTAPEGEKEIDPPDHFKSKVGRYFGFEKIQGKITGKDKVICRICRTKFSYHTTSNLRAHLSTLHPGKLHSTSIWRWLIHWPLVDKTYTTWVLYNIGLTEGI